MKYQKNKDEINENALFQRQTQVKKSDIDPKEICKVLPGLSAYEIPNDQMAGDFIRAMDPRKRRNMMILFLAYCFCIVVNFFSIAVKQDANDIYLMNKQVELFTFIDRDQANTTVLREIETRAQLFSYFNETFAKNLFHSDSFLNARETARLNSAPFSVLDFGEETAVMQRHMEIIG